MSLTQTVREEIADNLDKRRFEITNLRRVLLNYTGKPLESTALRMAIPLLYANWEGYYKEPAKDLTFSILAKSLTSHVKAFT